MLTLFIIDCFCLQHILLSHSPDDPHFAGDLERHFINTLVWVCGGFLSSANKTSFNEWWRATFNLHSPQYRYPEGGTLWDYHVKPGTHGFLSWAKQVPPFSLPSDGATPPFVHTARSVALADFVMQCLANGCPVLLNGLSGSGKTSLLKQLVCESSKPALPDTNLLHVYCNLLTSAEVVGTRFWTVWNGTGAGSTSRRAANDCCVSLMIFTIPRYALSSVNLPTMASASG